MGFGLGPDAIPVMELDRPVLLEHLDQGPFLLLGHDVKGAGEADAHGSYLSRM